MVHPFPNLTVVEHPLLQHKLALLRDRRTTCSTFRSLVKEAAMLIGYEATRDLDLTPVEIETPLVRMKAPMLSGKKLVLVSVLRAGNGFLDGLLELIPSARVGHIGLARDHATLEANEYYCKLPEDTGQREVLVLDPMLATGNSAIEALKRVAACSPRSIKLLTLIAAPEGVERLRANFPDVRVFTAALDERLNENGYILPGLGDAGDRIYGTK